MRKLLIIATLCIMPFFCLGIHGNVFATMGGHAPNKAKWDTKALSEEDKESLKLWLAQQGIDADRVEASAPSLKDSGAYLYKSELVGGKRGYVDLQYVFEQYKKTKDSEKALEKKTQECISERAPLVDEIRKAKGSERETLIEGQKRVDADTRNWLVSARNIMLNDILLNINAEIKSIGYAEGYSVVVNKKNVSKEANTIVDIDLTSRVIQNLNANYQESKNLPTSNNMEPKEISQIKKPNDQIVEPKGDDAISKLERLMKLKEKGVLTEKEFQGQKEKILSQ